MKKMVLLALVGVVALTIFDLGILYAVYKWGFPKSLAMIFGFVFGWVLGMWLAKRI